MKAYRSNGNLVIEIPEDQIVQGAEYNGGDDPLEVVDRERFLNYFATNLVNIGTHGAEALNVLLDVVAQQAMLNEEGIVCKNNEHDADE